MVVDLLGIGMIVVGIVLFAIELIHPGALLLIPGSILLVAGLLYVFFPQVLLGGPIGPILIILAAVGTAIAEIPLYRYFAPVHRPMTTTSSGLTGEVGVVIVPTIPDTLKGKVRVKSEIWSAQSDQPIPAGTHVRVVSGEGVAIRVVPIDAGASA